MVKILNQLKQDAKQALKKGEKDKSKNLRYLVSLLQTRQVEKGEDFSQSEAVSVLQKEMKQKKESLDAFEKAGREDLVEEQKKEISLLEQYMPRMMSKEDIVEIAEKIKKETGLEKFGPLMGKVMAEVKGKAEGDKVAEVVRSVLEK